MLVPDFMFRLMMPPRLLPFSASTLFFETVTSSTASIDGVYEVLKLAPSGTPSSSTSLARRVPPPAS